MKPWLVGALMLLSPSAFAQQQPPEIPFESVPNLLKLPPDMHLGEASGVTGNTVDQHVATLKSSGDFAVAGPKSNDPSEREKLIRRRWTETGIKMWNPDVRGAGHAALNIQGRVELLPVKPGETLPGYDKLEFKTVRSYVNGQAVNRIVCEGVVVDPPKRRK